MPVIFPFRDERLVDLHDLANPSDLLVMVSEPHRTEVAKSLQL